MLLAVAAAGVLAQSGMGLVSGAGPRDGGPVQVGDPPQPSTPWFDSNVTTTARSAVGLDGALAAAVVCSAGLLACFDAINMDTNEELIGRYSIPPDPHGAAGPRHLVSVVNSSIQVRSKSGTILGQASLPVFFGFARNATVFDPKVIYDAASDRFIVVALLKEDSLQLSGILLGATATGDPTGVWRIGAIDSKLTINETSHWADYPGLAVDEEAIYVTNNMYAFVGPGGSGSRLWIINKAQLYAGQAVSITVHDPWVESGGADRTGVPAIWTVQPALIFGSAPIGVGTWLVATQWYAAAPPGNDFLHVIRIDSPLASPTFTQSLVDVGVVHNINVAFPDAPQKGSAIKIETNDRRALHAIWRQGHIWITSTVVPPSGADAGEATAHWYQISTANLANPVSAGGGNVGGEDLDSSAHTFFPSIAVDADGNVAVGFGLSSPNHYAGAYYSIVRTPAGPVANPITRPIAAGVAPYVQRFGQAHNRWGDYSAIVVDPSDDASFWAFNEYSILPGSPFDDGDTGRWGTRWGRLSAYQMPSAVKNLEATSISGQVTVVWLAPTSDGGKPVLSYKAVISPGLTTITVAAAVTTATFPGLTNGTAYTVSVTAVNVLGEGPAAVSQPRTPATIPGAPQNVLATPGIGAVTVSWSPPASTGGQPITSYTVTTQPGGQTTNASGNATSALVQPLAIGSGYTFTVRAANVQGDGPESPPAGPVTPLGGALTLGSQYLIAGGRGAVSLTLTGSVSPGLAAYQMTLAYDSSRLTFLSAAGGGGPFSSAPNIVSLTPGQVTLSGSSVDGGATGAMELAGIVFDTSVATGCSGVSLTVNQTTSPGSVAFPLSAEPGQVCTVAPATVTATPAVGVHRDSSDYSASATWDGPGDGAAGVAVLISALRDSQGHPVSAWIGSYNAEFRYGPGCFAVLEIRDGDGFTTGLESITISPSGTAAFRGSSQGGAGSGRVLAFAPARLLGSADENCEVDLVVTELKDAKGNTLPMSPGRVAALFRRGDVHQDSAVRVADLLASAQYLVGIRPGCTVARQVGQAGATDCANVLSMASAKQDGTTDRPSVADVLAMAQRLVEIRNDNFDLP